MAIATSDSDAARRRIDEQDRLDAEEIMVAAMAASVGSSGSSRTFLTSNNSKHSHSTAVSSKRRNKPPELPPPPNTIMELPPPAPPNNNNKKWNNPNSTSFRMIIFTFIVSIMVSIGFATVISQQQQQHGGGGGGHGKVPTMGQQVVVATPPQQLMASPPNNNYYQQQQQHQHGRKEQERHHNQQQMGNTGTRSSTNERIYPDYQEQHAARFRSIQHYSTSRRIQYRATKYSGSKVPSIYLENTKTFISLYHHRLDLPVLFRIPLSGDESLTRAIGQCLHFVQAADQGEELLGRHHLMSLDLHTVNTTRGRFLNVDLSTYEGMEQARQINLVSSIGSKSHHSQTKMTTTTTTMHVLSSPLLHSILTLFRNVNQKARFFTMFQSPPQRMISLYFASKNVSSRYYDPGLEDVSLDAYANWPVDRPEFNFVIKSLVSSGDNLIASDDLTTSDLKLAKMILKERFMVLLSDDKFGSWAKLATWLGWKTSQSQRNCVDQIMERDWPLFLQETHQLSTDSDTYLRLEQRNGWDIQLYEFAQSLYQQQTEILVS